MKKILLASVGAFVILSGCAQNQPTQAEPVAAEQSAAQTIKFKGIGNNKKSATLKSNDQFQTATLHAPDGKTYELKRSIGAVGTLLENDSGVQFYFGKGGEAYFVPSKDDRKLFLKYAE